MKEKNGNNFVIDGCFAEVDNQNAILVSKFWIKILWNKINNEFNENDNVKPIME